MAAELAAIAAIPVVDKIFAVNWIDTQEDYNSLIKYDDYVDEFTWKTFTNQIIKRCISFDPRVPIEHINLQHTFDEKCHLEDEEKLRLEAEAKLAAELEEARRLAEEEEKRRLEEEAKKALKKKPVPTPTKSKNEVAATSSSTKGKQDQDTKKQIETKKSEEVVIVNTNPEIVQSNYLKLFF